MAILDGAVAYQEGDDQFTAEIQSWDLARHACVVGCPTGCSIQYDLYVEINATEEQVERYIDLIHRRLEEDGHTQAHAPKIRIDDPNP